MSLSYGGQITGLLTADAEYKGKVEINVNRQLFVAMNAEPWGAKGLAGQNVTELVLENLNDCILRLRAMGRASKVKSAIEKINILAELDIGVLRGLLETRLDPTAENSRLEVPINFTEIPAGEPFASMLPPTSEADTHSTPGNANISAGGKKARRQAANTRTGAPVSSPTGTRGGLMAIQDCLFHANRAGFLHGLAPCSAPSYLLSSSFG